MENYKLVMRGDLNHYGYLFGGYLLQWVDEYAWIAASLEYPGSNFVTIGMDRVEFRKSVREGTILRFEVNCVKRGRTSVTYGVNVYRGNGGGSQEGERIFSTRVTFVRIDDQGQKLNLPKCDIPCKE